MWVLAEDPDALTTPVGDVCTRTDDDVGQALLLVRERAVSRIPVIENGAPVGEVSIGDLAIERDERSALPDVSAAPPNT